MDIQLVWIENCWENHFRNLTPLSTSANEFGQIQITKLGIQLLRVNIQLKHTSIELFVQLGAFILNTCNGKNSPVISLNELRTAVAEIIKTLTTLENAHFNLLQLQFSFCHHHKLSQSASKAIRQRRR